jgi:hypothetical protein
MRKLHRKRKFFLRSMETRTTKPLIRACVWQLLDYDCLATILLLPDVFILRVHIFDFIYRLPEGLKIEKSKNVKNTFRDTTWQQEKLCLIKKQLLRICLAPWGVTSKNYSDIVMKSSSFIVAFLLFINSDLYLQ